MRRARYSDSQRSGLSGVRQVDPFPAIEFSSYSTVPSADHVAEWKRVALIFDAAAFESIRSSADKLAGFDADRCSAVLRRYEAPRATIANWDALTAAVSADGADTVGDSRRAAGQPVTVEVQLLLVVAPASMPQSGWPQKLD